VSPFTDPDTLAALEALLFASDAPLELSRIAEVLDLAPEDARTAVDALRAACDQPGRGLAVVDVAGGFRLVTRPEWAPALLRLQRLRVKSRLSRAALETLAIIGYRQPISRPEVEQLRGVGAESVLTHLLERRMVRVVGRKAGPGRPILYGTTREFLEHFGLKDLGDLPPFEVQSGSPETPVPGPTADDTSTPEAGAEDAVPPAAESDMPAAVAEERGSGPAGA
jgi:segregation and condensation protein B